MNKTSYCDRCNDEKEYSILTIHSHDNLYGKDFIYDHHEAICDACESYMHIPEIQDENLERYYEQVNIIKEKLNLL